MTEFNGTVEIKQTYRQPRPDDPDGIPNPVTTMTFNGDEHRIIIKESTAEDNFAQLELKGNLMDFHDRNYTTKLRLSLSENGPRFVMASLLGKKLPTFEFEGSNGDMNIYDEDGARSLAVRSKAFDGKTVGIWVGGAPSEGMKPGWLGLRDLNGNDSLILEGSTGRVYCNDIELPNADCAEDFDIVESESIEPGTVMVIRQDGKLKQCDTAYDKRVAGVISGACDFKPGIILDKKKIQNSRKSISLMGKVFCKVEADSSPVEVGDLLTTSSTIGHAMKAQDPTSSFGSVIGKALRPQESGKGLIPILIALQ